MYNHNNLCNIEIYFCNIQMKHLQHEFETSETRSKHAYRAIAIICHIHIKHLKHMFETTETLKT